MNNNNSCAILIASCKNYSDAWGPFFTLFFRYWPDCPFPVYVVTDGGEAPDPRVNMIVLDKDHGWSDNMKIAIQKIGAPYIIYILDDVPLMKKVDTARVLSLLDLIKKEHAGYLRLYPSPGPDKPYKDYSEVGLIEEGAPYRTSTMAAIWDVNVLVGLLLPGENAWQFEIIGTERSRNVAAPFLSVWPKDGAAIDHFATAIKKGRWQWDAVKFLESEGVKVDRARRAVEPYWFYLLRHAERLPILSPIIRRTRRLFFGTKPSLIKQNKS